LQPDSEPVKLLAQLTSEKPEKLLLTQQEQRLMKDEASKFEQRPVRTPNVMIEEHHVQLLSEFIIRASLGWRSLLAGDPSDHIQTHDGSMESTYERCHANKSYSKANTQSLLSQF
jgi:hypothetical protein